MLHVSTIGSRLHNPRILAVLAACPPYRITVSAYGATEASYDALVRRSGAFRLFFRGMAAALEAGLPLRLNIVLTKTNAHEQEAMIAMAKRWGCGTWCTPTSPPRSTAAVRSCPRSGSFAPERPASRSWPPRTSTATPTWTCSTAMPAAAHRLQPAEHPPGSGAHLDHRLGLADTRRGVHRRGLLPDPGDGSRHSASQAEALASTCPGWQQAPSAAIDIFALASARLYSEIARHDPQPFKQRLATVAHEWASHRMGTSSAIPAAASRRA